jgi:hypothetical protein
MNRDPKQRRRLCGLATTALLIAAAALWIPTTWRLVANQQGMWVGGHATVTQIELGVLEPLRLTWESSANGFCLGFTAVRLIPMFLSVTLTVAAVIVARRTYRLSRPVGLTGSSS